MLGLVVLQQLHCMSIGRYINVIKGAQIHARLARDWERDGEV